MQARREGKRGEFSRARDVGGGGAPALKNTENGVLDGFFLT